MEVQSKFWMVLGRAMPVFKHNTEQSARTEAERLAKINPGESFTVLESVGTCSMSSMVWQMFNEKPEVSKPFINNAWRWLEPHEFMRQGDSVVVNGIHVKVGYGYDYSTKPIGDLHVARCKSAE